MAGVGRLCISANGTLQRFGNARLQSGGFDYWDSGMDLRMGEDLYESFIRYQKWLLAAFAKKVKPYGFNTIDASASVEDVFTHLGGRVTKLSLIMAYSVSENLNPPLPGLSNLPKPRALWRPVPGQSRCRCRYATVLFPSLPARSVRCRDAPPKRPAGR